jgi:outer membrane biosynthesis protein TonB
MAVFQRSPLLESLGALDSTHRAPSIARAGIDAVSTPVCEYCPSPHFEKNPTNPLKGTIVLSALVSTDGSTTRINSVKDSDQRLLQPVIVAVSSWRLKPATGKDGKPVAVVMPIEVTFR